MKAIVIVAMMFFSSQFAEAKSIVIGPFPEGQSAIKGEIKNQVDKAAEAIRAANQGYQRFFFQPRITVSGSADKTGQEAQNDRLSRERADAVRGYLQALMPAAKLMPTVVLGSENNQRIVEVNGEFVLSSFGYFCILAILTLVVIFCLLSHYKKPQPVMVEKKYWRAVEFNAGGLRYRITPLMEAGKIVGIRPVQSEGEVRYPTYDPDNEKAFKDSTQGYVKSLGKDNPKELERLMEQKILTVIGPAKERGTNEKDSDVSSNVAAHAIVP